MTKRITIEKNEEIELTEREQLIYESGLKRGGIIALLICWAVAFIVVLCLD